MALRLSVPSGPVLFGLQGVRMLWAHCLWSGQHRPPGAHFWVEAQQLRLCLRDPTVPSSPPGLLRGTPSCHPSHPPKNCMKWLHRRLLPGLGMSEGGGLPILPLQPRRVLANTALRRASWCILWENIQYSLFIFWPYHMACRISVPWPGIKPRPCAVKVQNPNHWIAREFP